MDTLLLTRKDVATLLTLDECIPAVEQAFKLYAEGKALPPKVMGLHTQNGCFHIKAGILELEETFFVAKINSNFRFNTIERGLPLIQGVVVVCDGDDGRLLAVMDSIELTILRTGAATAVAAKYLALPTATQLTICGCGNQGQVSLKALMQVRAIEKVYAYDIDPHKADEFVAQLSAELRLPMEAVTDLGLALRKSDICITCTSSTQAFIKPEDIMPGCFIGAVGADSHEKQELDPELLASNKLVTDITEQCREIGELHHALKKGSMAVEDVYAELGDIIAGKMPGRTSVEEIIIFDSTGMALQDVATASIVYEKAVSGTNGKKFDFGKVF